MNDIVNNSNDNSKNAAKVLENIGKGILTGLGKIQASIDELKTYNNQIDSTVLPFIILLLFCEYFYSKIGMRKTIYFQSHITCEIKASELEKCCKVWSKICYILSFLLFISLNSCYLFQ